MRKNYFKTILIWVVAGVMIGTLIGVIGASGLISKEHYFSATNIIIKLCIGAIVMIIDLFCIYALLRPTFSNYIDKNGEKTKGKIEDFTVISHPNQIGEDEWVQKARYAFIISYEVNSKKYRKEYSPTCLTSKRELYPQVIEIGENIPIKYYKNVPYFSLIDIAQIKEETKKEQKNSKLNFIMLPIIITVVYIIALIML
jgi:hypothetical protein